MPSGDHAIETAFRYNNRKPMDGAHRLSYVMRKIAGKRATHKLLTGKAEGPKEISESESVRF
jgi:hypothetical protein